MKEISNTTKPQIGAFYKLTHSKIKTPWLKDSTILFVQNTDSFVKINLTEGAGYSSRWDWATQDAVTIEQVFANRELIEKLNRSIELGRTIARAELPKSHPFYPKD